MVDCDFGADDAAGNFETVAWRTEYQGAWTKAHRTNDRGLTTLCGVKIPHDVADSDSTSSAGRCKRCINLDKESR